MKRKGRLWLICILAVTAVLGLPCFVWAKGQDKPDGQTRIYDMARLFGEEKRGQFQDQIEGYQEQYHMDIVVVTTADTGWKDTTEYADDFYDKGGFAEDGILFLIDMDNRELTCSTRGKAIRIFTDSRIETILDGVYEGAADGDYEACVESFLSDVERFAKAGITGGQYNYDTETGRVSAYRSIRWYEALMALGVSGFVAGSACLGVKRRYAMEEDPRTIRNLNMAYRAEAKFAYDQETDRFVNRFVTTRAIPRNTGGGGGGRGGGSSAAGRSSTHTSSGGHTHGGGSRKF
ncbi:MAG: TPM domain-containing protein [Hungatella sp.]|nr:TPM domain-containing protein [Hungatella sp.]